MLITVSQYIDRYPRMVFRPKLSHLAKRTFLRNKFDHGEIFTEDRHINSSEAILASATNLANG